MNFTSLSEYKKYLAHAPRLTKEQLKSRRKDIDKFDIPNDETSHSDSLDSGHYREIVSKVLLPPTNKSNIVKSLATSNDSLIFLNTSDEESPDKPKISATIKRNVKRPIQLKKKSNNNPDTSTVNNTCVVCFTMADEKSSVNNLLKCNGCLNYIHLDCYGWNAFDCDENDYTHFRCDACIERDHDLITNENKIKCHLCFKSDGLMKRSICGKLCHTICVIFCPELTVEYGSANNLHELLPDRESLFCLLCRKQGGSCIQCSYGRCLAAFHPYCAYKENILLLYRESIAAIATDKHSTRSQFLDSSLLSNNSCSSSGSSNNEEGFDYELYCYDHQRYFNSFRKDPIVAAHPQDSISSLLHAHVNTTSTSSSSTTATISKSRTTNLQNMPSSILSSPITLTQAIMFDSEEKHITTREQRLYNPNNNKNAHLKRKRLKKLTENNANIGVHMTESNTMPKQLPSLLPYKDLGPYLRLTDTVLNKENKKQNKLTTMGYFEHEAELSGSDSGDDTDNDRNDDNKDNSQNSYYENDSFINDGEYTQYDDEGILTQNALYLEVNNKLFNSKKSSYLNSTSNNTRKKKKIQKNKDIMESSLLIDSQESFHLNFRGADRCIHKLKQLACYKNKKKDDNTNNDHDSNSDDDDDDDNDDNDNSSHKSYNDIDDDSNRYDEDDNDDDDRSHRNDDGNYQGDESSLKESINESFE